MGLGILERELQTSKELSQIILEVKEGLKNQTLTYSQAIKDKTLLETLEPQNFQQIDDVLKLSKALTEEIPIIELKDYAKPNAIYLDDEKGWISWPEMNKIHNKKYYPTIPLKNINKFLKLEGKKPKYWNGDYKITDISGNIIIANPTLDYKRLEKVCQFYSQRKYIPKDEDGNIEKRGLCWVNPEDVVQSNKRSNELIARIKDAIIFIRQSSINNNWKGDIKFIRLDNIQNQERSLWASGKKTINDYKQYVKKAFEYYAS